MLSLLKLDLSKYAEKPRFGSFNLNNSELFKFSFEDHFLRTLDIHTKKKEYTLGSSGGGGGAR